MAKLDEQSSEVKTKKAKTIDGIIFLLLLIGAVAMVFPLLYMVLSSFMTKNQILSANFSIIPDPWKFGKYSEVLQKPEFKKYLSCCNTGVGSGSIHFFPCSIFL